MMSLCRIRSLGRPYTVIGSSLSSSLSPSPSASASASSNTITTIPRSNAPYWRHTTWCSFASKTRRRAQRREEMERLRAMMDSPPLQTPNNNNTAITNPQEVLTAFAQAYESSLTTTTTTTSRNKQKQAGYQRYQQTRQKQRLHKWKQGRRLFTPTPALHHPHKVIQGVTTPQVQTNPDLAAYFAANFPPVHENDPTYQELYYEQLPIPPTDLQRRNIRSIYTYTRHQAGTRACRELRRHSRLIPGVIYGSDPTRHILSTDQTTVIPVKTPLKIIHQERNRFSHHFQSRVYELTLYDRPPNHPHDVDHPDFQGTIQSKQLVVPCDLQMHPILNNPYCLNYVRYHPGRPIALPIAYVNEEESPALKRGGFIIPVNKYLTCVVEEGVPIPEQLFLDCAGAKHKEKMRIDRILFPDGVKPAKSVNTETFLHGPVVGKFSAADVADGQGATEDGDGDEDA